MSSEVDICNLALSHLGDEAQVAAIAPPDGSIQSAHCARFYPIARGALLEAHPWPFATKRITIPEVANPSPDDWAYAYAVPSTCIRPLSALFPGAPARNFGLDTDADTYPYLVEADADGDLILYTNVQTATLRYIDLVEDASKYPPLFVLALARLLASFLAGPVLKGDTGMKVAQAHLKIFEMEFAKAAASSANVGKRDFATFQPSFIAARGLSRPPQATE